MTAATVSPHPLLAAVTSARRELAGVAEVQPVYLAPGQKKAARLELAAAEAQLAELKFRILAASDDVAESTGARNAGQWLA
jgi:hypothetical protein